MNKTDKHDYSALARHRSNIYGLLATVYRQEITSDRLYQIKDPQFLGALSDIGLEGSDGVGGCLRNEIRLCRHGPGLSGNKKRFPLIPACLYGGSLYRWCFGSPFSHIRFGRKVFTFKGRAPSLMFCRNNTNLRNAG